jgi:hypothetical protein
MEVGGGGVRSCVFSERPRGPTGSPGCQRTTMHHRLLGPGRVLPVARAGRSRYASTYAPRRRCRRTRLVHGTRAVDGPRELRDVSGVTWRSHGRVMTEAPPSGHGGIRRTPFCLRGGPEQQHQSNHRGFEPAPSEPSCCNPNKALQH